ncbi:MAG: 50S ribosomal protein L19 [bacterium]|nr:50S ribosomal protein L19 [bacterium]
MVVSELANKFEGVRVGMTVRVHQKIKDVNPKGEEKERIQIFEGMVIKQKGGTSPRATLTIRKISNGVGVEKIYPIHLPSIEKVVPVKQLEVRRAKLYYLRTSKKKIKETPIK